MMRVRRSIRFQFLYGFKASRFLIGCKYFIGYYQFSCPESLRAKQFEQQFSRKHFLPSLNE